VFVCCSDRPWLTESQQVQKLQEKVYVALQHSMHMNGATTEKLDKVRNKTHKRHFTENCEDI